MHRPHRRASLFFFRRARTASGARSLSLTARSWPCAAMLALNNVHPVTHAVANTIKRVVILLACVIVFQTPMTPLCTAGSAIAIVGGYLYSLAKGREKAAAKAAKEA